MPDAEDRRAHAMERARELGERAVDLTDRLAHLEAGESPNAADVKRARQAAQFSAALVRCGTGMFIVENDAHALVRRRASLAHEMAHVLWEHEFTTVLVNGDGCRAVAPAVEAEADRLGGELLIPFKAALAAARREWSDEEVAAAFEVSVPYARMRMNLSGARKVASRQRAARSRA